MSKLFKAIVGIGGAAEEEGFSKKEKREKLKEKTIKTKPNQE